MPQLHAVPFKSGGVMRGLMYITSDSVMPVAAMWLKPGLSQICRDRDGLAAAARGVTFAVAAPQDTVAYLLLFSGWFAPGHCERAGNINDINDFLTDSSSHNLLTNIGLRNSVFSIKLTCAQDVIIYVLKITVICGPPDCY